MLFLFPRRGFHIEKDVATHSEVIYGILRSRRGLSAITGTNPLEVENMTQAIARTTEVQQSIWTIQTTRIGTGVCPYCASEEGQWRGYRERRDGTVLHRWWCRQCEKWSQHFKASCSSDKTARNRADTETDKLADHLVYDTWIEAHEDTLPAKDAP